MKRTFRNDKDGGSIMAKTAEKEGGSIRIDIDH